MFVRKDVWRTLALAGRCQITRLRRNIQYSMGGRKYRNHDWIRSRFYTDDIFFSSFCWHLIWQRIELLFFLPRLPRNVERILRMRRVRPTKKWSGEWKCSLLLSKATTLLQWRLWQLRPVPKLCQTSRGYQTGYFPLIKKAQTCGSRLGLVEISPNCHADWTDKRTARDCLLASAALGSLWCTVCLFLFLEWVGDFHKHVSGGKHDTPDTASHYDDMRTIIEKEWSTLRLDNCNGSTRTLKDTMGLFVPTVLHPPID
jgi:hypothetical protein